MFKQSVTSLLSATTWCFETLYKFLFMDDGSIIYKLIIWFFIILTFSRFVLVPFIGGGLGSPRISGSDSVKKLPENNQYLIG